MDKEVVYEYIECLCSNLRDLCPLNWAWWTFEGATSLFASEIHNYIMQRIAKIWDVYEIHI